MAKRRTAFTNEIPVELDSCFLLGYAQAFGPLSLLRRSPERLLRRKICHSLVFPAPPKRLGVPPQSWQVVTPHQHHTPRHSLIFCFLNRRLPTLAVARRRAAGAAVVGRKGVVAVLRTRSRDCVFPSIFPFFCGCRCGGGYGSMRTVSNRAYVTRVSSAGSACRFAGPACVCSCLC